MPTETNLPTKVHLYLEIIERLTNWHDGFDSNSPEHGIFEMEVRYYLALIRKELTGFGDEL